MKVLLISHERSGWHFIANSIAFNYRFSNIQIDLPMCTSQEKLMDFFEEQSHFERRALFKSHHDYEALMALWPIIAENFKVVYLVRDGRDVMTSCMYYFNMYHPRGFFCSDSVGALMRTDPRPFGFHHCYWRRPVESMADRWDKHVTGYLGMIAKNLDAHIVSYEDLVFRFQETLDGIGEYLELKRIGAVRRPTLADRCVYPRKGIVGDWKLHFTEKDEEWFWRKAGAAMAMGGYKR